jgi:hypothetical protein
VKSVVPGADHRGDAERLLETVSASCDLTADFPDQLRSALAAALDFLASAPDAAHVLCVEQCEGDDLSAQGRPRWLETCAAKLRRAAQACPRAGTPPLFLEAVLLGGIYWTVAEHVRVGQLDQVPGLLPDLLECTLAYYLDPTEVSRIGAAARASG